MATKLGETVGIMGVLVPEGPIRSNLFEWADSGVQDRISRHMRQVFQLVTAEGVGLLNGVANITQVSYLSCLARSAGVSRVAEVGFNIGFSSLAFLESGPDVQVVSFEIDTARAVRVAKEFIDSTYPGRHELVYGDSAETLPKYAAQCADGDGFDLIFLDGGHDYGMISADISNSRRLARENAIVIVDDMTPWYPWGVGAMSAWTEAVDAGIIAPLEYVCDGIPRDAVEGPADRVWAVGRFE